MSVLSRRWVRRLVGIGAVGLGLILVAEARAGWPRRARVAPTSYYQVAPTPSYRVVPTAAARPSDVARSPMLGSFYPEPVLNVRGNYEAGGGYSPLGLYGDATAVMYGPLSSFRAASTPVLLYQRGYDGTTRPRLGTGFSTPNFPSASPIVYPSRANVVGAPKNVTTPPQWDSGINFIDLN